MGTIADQRAKRKTLHYSPKPEEAELVRYICEQVSLGEQQRQAWAKDAWLGLAYYLGHQYARWDDRTARLRNDTPKRYDRRMVLNQTAPLVDTVVSKLTMHKPGWFVPPQTNTEEDIAKAGACTKRLEYEYHQQSLRLQAIELIRWAVITGVGIARVTWNPLGGDRYVSEDGTEVTPGEPSFDVCSPLLTYFDPGGNDSRLRDTRWVAEVRYMHVDEIDALYPDKGKYVQPDTTVTGDNFSASLLNEYQGRDSNTRASDLSDRVKVTAYYERSSSRHKKGLYAVTAGGLLLDQGELPFDMLPFAIIRFLATPGKLFGQGLPERVRAAQDMVNEQISQRLKAVALTAAPKWTAEENSIKATAITSEPGEVVFHKPGTPPPRPAQQPQVSPQHEALERAGLMYMKEIAGVSDISLGAVPSGISGRAAQYQAEQDASKFAPVSGGVEAAYERIGSLMLRLIRAYGPPEQQLRIVGEDRRVEVVEFYSSDITSYDVRVTEGSMAVKHPSVERESAMMAFDRGLYGDKSNPENIARARRDMGYGDTDYIYGNNDSETLYAKEENYRFLNGGASEVMPYEDHAAHLFTHRKALQSVEFRNLPNEERARFILHVAQHEKAKFASDNGKPWWLDLLGPVEMTPPVVQPPAEQEAPAAEDVEEQGEAEYPYDEPEQAGYAVPGAMPQMTPRGPGVAEFDNAPNEPELPQPGQE